MNQSQVKRSAMPSLDSNPVQYWTFNRLKRFNAKLEDFATVVCRPDAVDMVDMVCDDEIDFFTDID